MLGFQGGAISISGHEDGTFSTSCHGNQTPSASGHEDRKFPPSSHEDGPLSISGREDGATSISRFAKFGFDDGDILVSDALLVPDDDESVGRRGVGLDGLVVPDGMMILGGVAADGVIVVMGVLVMTALGRGDEVIGWASDGEV